MFLRCVQALRLAENKRYPVGHLNRFDASTANFRSASQPCFHTCLWLPESDGETAAWAVGRHTTSGSEGAAAATNTPLEACERRCVTNRGVRLDMLAPRGSLNWGSHCSKLDTERFLSNLPIP
jgi:nicotinamidase-related amidase